MIHRKQRQAAKVKKQQPDRYPENRAALKMQYLVALYKINQVNDDDEQQ